jgi:hypothetical protein
MEQGTGKGGLRFPSAFHKYLARPFEIDLRSLAAVRIALATVMLVDLCTRANFLTELHTDQGVAPRALFTHALTPLSPYFWNGSPAWVAVLFVLHALVALALLVGFRTRVATLGCLFLTWALIERNPLASHAGDSLLLWTLGWLAMLPAGAAASVDALTARAPRPRPRTVTSVASAALLLQVVLVYLASAHAKLVSDAWLDLRAVGTIMQLHYATPLGGALARYDQLTRLLTAATLLLETLGPPVALFGAVFPPVRAAIVLLFVLFHLALGMTLYLGTFPLICIAAWLAFVPGGVWDGSAARAASRAWRALTLRLAAAIEASPFAPLAVRDPWAGTGRLAQCAAAAALAFVCAVNAAEHLSFHGRNPALLARLPRGRQVWSVMARPVNEATSLVVTARLRDGTDATLFPAPPSHAPTLDLLWPPYASRELNCRFRLLNSALSGQTEGVRRFAGQCRAQWEAAHPPSQGIETLQVYCDYQRVRTDSPSLTLVSNPQAAAATAAGRVLVWTSKPTPPRR